MPASPLAIAADYADALPTARRAKTLLILSLIFILLGQVALFLVIRYHPGIVCGVENTDSPATAPATRFSVPKLLEWLVAITGFLGLMFALVLAAVQLLILGIMLVGRLIGVSKVTSAFLWSILLIVLLFPWQSVMMSPTTTLAGTKSFPDTEFKIPGVLYTWGEVTHPAVGATFDAGKISRDRLYLCWARFALWPAVAVLMLLVIYAKSSAGLGLALGETEYDALIGQPQPPPRKP